MDHGQAPLAHVGLRRQRWPWATLMWMTHSCSTRGPWSSLVSTEWDRHPWPAAPCSSTRRSPHQHVLGGAGPTAWTRSCGHSGHCSWRVRLGFLHLIIPHFLPDFQRGFMNFFFIHLRCCSSRCLGFVFMCRYVLFSYPHLSHRPRQQNYRDSSTDSKCDLEGRKEASSGRTGVGPPLPQAHSSIWLRAVPREHRAGWVEAGVTGACAHSGRKGSILHWEGAVGPLCPQPGQWSEHV